MSILLLLLLIFTVYYLFLNLSVLFTVRTIYIISKKKLFAGLNNNNINLSNFPSEKYIDL